MCSTALLRPPRAGSWQGPHLAKRWEPRGFSRVAAAFSSYDGDLSLPLGLALGEVKWALGSIIVKKASGGDGIPVEPSEILKDDARQLGWGWFGAFPGAALSQHHLLGFEIAQLEFHHLH